MNQPSESTASRRDTAPGMLVLCTGNSARSQMAEALLRRRLAGSMPVYSAGTEPADEVHPLAVRALEEIGLEVENRQPTHVSRYLGQIPVHTVVTVCADADEKCPSVWPGVEDRQHWPFDDPAAAEGSEEERLAMFRTIRDAIDERIERWWKEVSAPGE